MDGELINKHDLIDNIMSHEVSMSVCLTQDERAGMARMRRMVLEDITSEPTVKPPQQWIPCAERLPKLWGFYLVTTRGGKDVEILCFEPGLNEWHKRGMWYPDEKYYDADYVVAWMPRPKAYEEEDSK